MRFPFLLLAAGSVLGSSSVVTAASERYVAPTRPSAPTEQVDLSSFAHLSEPLPGVGSTMLMISIAVLVAVVVVTLVALRSAGMMRAEGSKAWAWTLSAKIVALGGSLLTGVAFIGVLLTSVSYLNDNDTQKHQRLLDRVALMERLDRVALEARIHARGFLLFQRNEDVELFLNAYTATAKTLEMAEKAASEPDDQKKLAELKDALAHYGAVITNAVGLTDKIAMMTRGQIQPDTQRLLEILPNLDGLSPSERSTISLGVVGALARVSEMVTSGSTTDAGALSAALREHEGTLRRVAGASPAGQPARAKAENAATIAASLADQVQELAKVIEARFDVIFSQCPPSGHRLGELAQASSKAIESRVAAMQAESRARSSQLIGIAEVLICVALVIAGAFCATTISRIRAQMSSVIAAVERIGQGDLRPTEGEPLRRDEFGVLRRLVDGIAQSLRKTLGEVASASGAVSRGAGEIMSSSRSLSESLTHCEQQTQQVSAAIEELSSSVGGVLERSREALAAAENSGSKAAQGGDVVGQTIVEMRAIADQVDASARSISELGKKSEEIGRIIGVINDIADQTNLLALNAAIEAARAGEHGRGFAVVADEVRKLAERTTHATKEVAQSIRDIQDRTGEAVSTIQQSSGRVGRGVELASDAGSSLKEIVGGSDSLRSMVQTIATASDQQSQASADVARSVSTIAELSRSLSSSSQRSMEAAESFTRQAGVLDAAIGRFKL
jgi:methyl-accepting chemotaxis protein